jgi:excisionase family DNA binding protein
MSFEPEPYVDVIRVAEHLGVTRMGVNEWRRRLGLPSYKIGHARRYKLSEIDAWAASLPDQYAPAGTGTRARRDDVA